MQNSQPRNRALSGSLRVFCEPIASVVHIVTTHRFGYILQNQKRLQARCNTPFFARNENRRMYETGWRAPEAVLVSR